MLVGEEKPAAGFNASRSGKCQQIDFSAIAACPETLNLDKNWQLFVSCDLEM